ncbi:22834_t:CDS:2 [Entrophospora sp. SA101]|nr:14461_t:CDS:2 [Entrophospora sp. SA101]CAJ0746783.1 6212_t:CDS:2 [Entrophospora sp. SA101]CAJ0749820.1 22834_t:CDS:2 [Entrophospora sp. SA101]CAJ0861469.1 11594_t:CDS:2 [Entrophospora sp. SA101]
MSKQKKAPAAKSNDAEQIILGYLREHNRPYSATDIINNLGGAVTKTVAQKALNSLVKKEEIRFKTYGKQTIYCIQQNQNYSERLQELQSGIAQISEEEKKKIEDEYEKNLKFWRQRKRMEELDIEIDLIGEDSLKAL